MLAAKEKILHLSLHADPFNVMVTGEKKGEWRKASQWILSRLEKKDYTHIKFTNGYGAKRPYFICNYLGWWYASKSHKMRYTNGLIVDVEAGDIVIALGKIVEKGNIL